MQGRCLNSIALEVLPAGWTKPPRRRLSSRSRQATVHSCTRSPAHSQFKCCPSRARVILRDGKATGRAAPRRRAVDLFHPSDRPPPRLRPACSILRSPKSLSRSFDREGGICPTVRFPPALLRPLSDRLLLGLLLPVPGPDPGVLPAFRPSVRLRSFPLSYSSHLASSSCCCQQG